MKEDSERIGRIETRVEALQDGQAKLEKGQQNLEQRFERLSDDVTFVIQTLDRHHEEMKRYFGILIEQPQTTSTGRAISSARCFSNVTPNRTR